MGYVSTRAETDKTDPYGRQMPTGAMMYMGDPDGPLRFIPSLGMEVPTYINPRDDLKTKANCAKAHISVDYHIPPPVRGTYVPQDLANYDSGNHYVLTAKMKVRCGGLDRAGQICQKSAVNRTGFCTNHGGALHPADKFYTADRGVAPTQLEKLTRLEKVMLGIIPVSELSNDEIAKQAIRDDDGNFVPPNRKIAPKLADEMNREFYDRANRFIRENTLDMLEVMVDIARSQLAEDADRQKAAQWMIERSLGKTPDVLITNKTDRPFETLMADITSGSREEYRNSQQAIGAPEILEGEFHVIDDVDEDEDDDEPTVDGSAIPESQPVGVGAPTGTEGIPESGDKSSQRGDLADPEDIRQDILERQAEQAKLARERKELDEARQRIKRRKYAAKSQGLTTLDNLAYGVEFKTEKTKTGTQTRMKLISPDATKLPRSR